MSFLALDYTVLIHMSAHLLIRYLFSDIAVLIVASFIQISPSINIQLKSYLF